MSCRPGSLVAPGARPKAEWHRFGGMTTPTRRLIQLALAAGGLLAFAWVWTSPSPAPAPATTTEPKSADLHETVQDPLLAPEIDQTYATPRPPNIPEDPESAAPESVPPADYRSFAVGLHEMRGLPAEAPPGSRWEIWAAWDSPVAESPMVQRLVREVILEAVHPPVTPEGPHTATLLLERKQVKRFLWGYQWGSLTAVRLTD
jgi:hypothetical protein